MHIQDTIDKNRIRMVDGDIYIRINQGMWCGKLNWRIVAGSRRYIPSSEEGDTVGIVVLVVERAPIRRSCWLLRPSASVTSVRRFAQVALILVAVAPQRVRRRWWRRRRMQPIATESLKPDDQIRCPESLNRYSFWNGGNTLHRVQTTRPLVSTLQTYTASNATEPTTCCYIHLFQTDF